MIAVSFAARAYVRPDHADSEPILLENMGLTRGDVFVTDYTCRRFAVGVKSGGRLSADTQIEHIVAAAEAHDSGLAPSLRHDFINDLENQTLSLLRRCRTRRFGAAV